MKVETIYVFDNFVKDTSLFIDKAFNIRLKNILNTFIENNIIKGAFFTYYGNETHIKVGLWLNNSSEENIVKIRENIMALLNKNLIRQNNIKKEIINLYNKTNLLTGLIACFSFKLSDLIYNQPNSLIVMTYKNIMYFFFEKSKYSGEQLLKNFSDFRKLYPKYFLSQFNLDNVIWKQNILAKEVLDFSQSFFNFVNKYISDKENLWFIFDRLFHHCNNINQIYESKEMEIFIDLMNQINND